MAKTAMAGLFPSRVLHCLYQENIETLEQLAQHSDTYLLRLPNFGRGSLHLVKEALAAHGLKQSEDKASIKSDLMMLGFHEQRLREKLAWLAKERVRLTAKLASAEV